jgi:hypothetical protein
MFYIPSLVRTSNVSSIQDDDGVRQRRLVDRSLQCSLTPFQQTFQRVLLGGPGLGLAEHIADSVRDVYPTLDL